jgi:hypothetical protein
MTAAALERPPIAPGAITNAAEAAALAAHFAEVMDALVEVVEEETQLVRAGRGRQATELATAKTDLARLYLADAARVKECRAHLGRHAPDLLKALQQRHDKFRALLQINLTVLATAHAVAEGVVRGVSGELARKSSPQTYTASGRNVAPPRSAPPIAVSRSLSAAVSRTCSRWRLLWRFRRPSGRYG